MTVFSTSLSVIGVATTSAYLLLPSLDIVSSRLSYRHVLTGSYHNFFRIFDTETTGDVVLQADKSAFKAKKMGGPLPNKNGLKNGRPGGLRDAMQMETLDFNKKILHASWHPRENTIAVSVILYYANARLTCRRSPQRTTCSSIARHELPARLVQHALPQPFTENIGFPVDARPQDPRPHTSYTRFKATI